MKDGKIVSADELAEAFKPDTNSEGGTNSKNKTNSESKDFGKSKKNKGPKKSRKCVASLSIFIVGIITLIVGVIFLILNLNKGVSLQDGEYLVSADNWTLEEDSNCGDNENCFDEPNVIWDFTEIGKGTLTTNNHINDYVFVWAIEDGKLKIRTDWLYELENEYEYELDQNVGILTLKTEDEEFRFVANFENS